MSITVIFGAKWDAPICEGDDVVVVEAPLGAPCLDCGVAVEEGDQGQMIPVMGDGPFERRPMHKECLLLSVAGHTYGVCDCSDYGGTGSRRAGALQLWKELVKV